MSSPADSNCGRPRQGARQQLLDAAAYLFARDGLEKVSIRAIALEAGMSHASVGYHFKSKQELYEEVLLTYGPRVPRDQIEAAYREEGDPDDPTVALRRLRAWITDLLQAVGRPTGISDGLMMQELCRPDGPSDVLFEARIRPHHDELESLIAAYRPDWDARRCRVVALGIIAQAVYFRVARPVASRLLERDCLATECAEEVSAILTESILDGIKAR